MMNAIEARTATRNSIAKTGECKAIAIMLAIKEAIARGDFEVTIERPLSQTEELLEELGYCLQGNGDMVTVTW